MNYRLFYKVLSIAIFQLFNKAIAQKLPNKQETSIWAPANIKIDGKSIEWSNQFQAYNNATGLFYTIANDSDNIYLVAYLTDLTSIFSKVMTGGITFIIKNPSQEIIIRYPAFAHNDIPSLAHPPKGQIVSGREDDSVIVGDNIVFHDKATEVSVKGVKNIDTLISIYNEYGIKAYAKFDAKQKYLYKLTVPLKYLGLKAGATFKYQILLNGGPNKYVASQAKMTPVTGGWLPDGTPLPQSEIDAMNARVSSTLSARYATTDFSGEYTLAKKP